MSRPSPFVRFDAFTSDHGDRRTDDGDDRADREDRNPGTSNACTTCSIDSSKCIASASFRVRYHTHGVRVLLLQLNTDVR